METTSIQWKALADLYLQANNGSYLPGLIHNLNNYSHVLDLQMELLQTKLSMVETSGSEILKKPFDRISLASKDLLHILENVSHRFFFCQKENIQIDFFNYFNWFQDFWTNNLFYKHRVNLELSIADNCVNLDLPPYLLTLCMEEPFKNGLEACQEANPEENYTFLLSVKGEGNGVLIQLTTPLTLPEALDNPFEAWATTKENHLGMGLSIVEHFASMAEWSVNLDSKDRQSMFTLHIPEIHTSVNLS